LKTGDEFRIAKVAVQNGRKVTARVDFEVVEKTPAPVPPPADVLSDDGFKELMQRCVQEAVAIVKEVIPIPWPKRRCGVDCTYHLCSDGEGTEQ
jgi:hypothetical protein